MTLLDVDSISVRFGGHTALDSVSLTVERGSITGLIGPNGAGKTTLFNVLSGLQRPTAGSVHFDGIALDRRPPYKRTHLGVSRTFQRLELFTSMTVFDNVKVAGDIRNRWSLRARARSDAAAEAREILELVGLSDIAEADVTSIPTGQARVVELARALMTRPRLLLLDEPASGQDEHETESFGRILETLRDQGMTVLLVEHDMSLVMNVCDHIHVLDFGSILASGAPDVIQTHPLVLAAYLGTEGAA